MSGRLIGSITPAGLRRLAAEFAREPVPETSGRAQAIRELHELADLMETRVPDNPRHRIQRAIEVAR